MIRTWGTVSFSLELKVQYLGEGSIDLICFWVQQMIDCQGRDLSCNRQLWCWQTLLAGVREWWVCLQRVVSASTVVFTHHKYTPPKTCCIHSLQRGGPTASKTYKWVGPLTERPHGGTGNETVLNSFKPTNFTRETLFAILRSPPTSLVLIYGKNMLQFLF